LHFPPPSCDESKPGASGRWRIQATTDPANRPEVRCLEKLGFTVEGVVRRAQWRGGRWHDQVLLSVLRDEFERGVPDA
jgi:RimJ/RimL family protein N-acetyltransferase